MDIVGGSSDDTKLTLSLVNDLLQAVSKYTEISEDGMDTGEMMYPGFNTLVPRMTETICVVQISRGGQDAIKTLLSSYWSMLNFTFRLKVLPLMSTQIAINRGIK